MKRSDDELMSERTVLRPFTQDDCDELFALFRAPAIRLYLLDDSLVSAEWVHDEIVASHVRFASSGAGLWSVRLKDDAKIIGFVGFREFFDPPQLQLLYGLLPEYWGRGLATEVAASICNYAFRTLDFSEVAAAVNVPYAASAKVLDRLGMQLKRRTSDGAAGTAFYVLNRSAW